MKQQRQLIERHNRTAQPEPLADRLAKRALKYAAKKAVKTVVAAALWNAIGPAAPCVMDALDLADEVFG